MGKPEEGERKWLKGPFTLAGGTRFGSYGMEIRVEQYVELPEGVNPKDVKWEDPYEKGVAHLGLEIKGPGEEIEY
jgi:hypothetical protein